MMGGQWSTVPSARIGECRQVWCEGYSPRVDQVPLQMYWAYRQSGREIVKIRLPPVPENHGEVIYR